MDLLNGGGGRSNGQERPPTIVLEVPLTEESVSIDFMQLAEQKYGWAAVHPVEARWKAAHGQDSEDESDSEQPASGAEQAIDRGRKRRRRNDMEYYDVEDPFIDDDELKLQETAAATKDGFFVWHGPLVQEGERVRVEKLGGPKKRKRPAKGQSSREKATAERATQIAARQAAEEARLQAEKQRELEDRLAREKAIEREREEREERERQEREREKQEAIATAAAAAEAIVAATQPIAVDGDDTDSSDEEKSAGQVNVEVQTPSSADDQSKKKRSKPSAEVLARRAAARREQRAAKKAAQSVGSPTRQDSPVPSVPTTPAPQNHHHQPIEVDSPTGASTPMPPSATHSEDESRTPVPATTTATAKRVSKPQTEEQKAAAKKRREKYRLNKLAQKRTSDDPGQARVLAKAVLNPAIDTSRVVITPALQQAIDAIKAEQAAQGPDSGSPSGRDMSVHALIS